MTLEEQAQNGLTLLKEAIYELIKQHPNGIGNSDVSRMLNIESDFEGNQSNYFAYSIIGLLVNEGKVTHWKEGNRKYYKVIA